MTEARQLLQTICVEGDYRFFSGVYSYEFDLIYKNMSAKFMHYMPAIDVEAVLGLSIGVGLSGFNSVVLLKESDFKELFDKYSEVLSLNIFNTLFVIHSETKGKDLNLNFMNLKKFKLGKGVQFLVVNCLTEIE